MISEVMPTIAVMPITMPSTVNPERILFVRTVSNAITMTSLNRSRRADMRYSRLSASMGSSRAARNAGYEYCSNDAAKHRQHNRLGEHLRHDVGPACPKRFTQADLTRPLADDHQHDVHDDDAADDE